MTEMVRGALRPTTTRRAWKESIKKFVRSSKCSPKQFWTIRNHRQPVTYHRDRIFDCVRVDEIDDRIDQHHGHREGAEQHIEVVFVEDSVQKIGAGKCYELTN